MRSDIFRTWVVTYALINLSLLNSRVIIKDNLKLMKVTLFNDYSEVNGMSKCLDDMPSSR